MMRGGTCGREGLIDRVFFRERPVPRVTAACRDGSLGSSGSREELSSGLSSEGSYYSLEGDQVKEFLLQFLQNSIFACLSLD